MAQEIPTEDVAVPEVLPDIIPFPISGLMALNIGGFWSARGFPHDVPAEQLLARAESLCQALRDGIAQRVPVKEHGNGRTHPDHSGPRSAD